MILFQLIKKFNLCTVFVMNKVIKYERKRRNLLSALKVTCFNVYNSINMSGNSEKFFKINNNANSHEQVSKNYNYFQH